MKDYQQEEKADAKQFQWIVESWKFAITFAKEYKICLLFRSLIKDLVNQVVEMEREYCSEYFYAFLEA